MAKRKQTYEVTGQNEVLGHQPGETFEGPLPEWIIEEALLASGALSIVEGKKSEPVEKIVCPACAETMKRPPKFDSHDELVAHYADKHPALAPPEKEE